MRKKSSVTPAMQQHFVQEILPRVEWRARHHFAQVPQPKRDEMVLDVTELAWKAYATNPHARERANVWKLASYCCYQVAVGRSIAGWKGRSFDGVGAQQKGIRRWDLADYVSERDNPADIVAFRLDVPAWLATLEGELKRTAEALLGAGPEVRGLDIAKDLGVSPGRLSQRRRELLQSWEDFTS